MSKYDEMSTDDLGSLFSDYYKEVNGFRPRFVDFEDRVALINELEFLDDDMHRRKSTPEGRERLRFEGWYVPYEHGDTMNFRGVAYKVTFVWSSKGEAEEYEITPIARTDVRKRRVTVAEINKYEAAQRDAEFARLAASDSRSTKKVASRPKNR